jgi:hypothetical protein
MNAMTENTSTTEDQTQKISNFLCMYIDSRMGDGETKKAYYSDIAGHNTWLSMPERNVEYNAFTAITPDKPIKFTTRRYSATVPEWNANNGYFVIRSDLKMPVDQTEETEETEDDGMENIVIDDGFVTISVFGHQLEDTILSNESTESQVEKLKHSRDLMVEWFTPLHDKGASTAISKVYGENSAILTKMDFVVRFGGGLKLKFSIDMVFCELVYYVKLEKKNLGTVGSCCCISLKDAIGHSLKMLRAYMLPKYSSEHVLDILNSNGQ